MSAPAQRRDDANPKPWRCLCGNLIGGAHNRCPGCGGRRIKVVEVCVHDAHADSLYGGDR